jgi:iron complex outermembrane receptor protein
MFDKFERSLIALITPILFVFISGFGSAALAQTSESSERGNVLEEVTVTAQRREQSVMDIPAALSVVTGDDIRQRLIKTSHDLELSVPGLNFMSVSGTSQVTLRGVGTSYSGPALNNSVALYIDDAYISNQVGAIEIFYDMNRVEVLKGPQPTLYGRNATGGAIQYLSNRPNLDRPEGYAEAGLAELDTFEFEGAWNQPLGESWALRVAAKYWDRGEGHVTSIVNGDKITGENEHQRIRAQLLFQPNEQLSMVGKYEYTHDKGDEPLRRQNATGLLCRYCVGGDDGDALGWYETAQTPQDIVDLNIIEGWGRNPIAADTLKRDRKVDHFALNIDWAFNDAWKLTSVTLYREIRGNGGQDQDANAINALSAFAAKTPDDGPDGIVYQSFTQEFRIASDSDSPLNWTFGVVYGEDDNQFAFGVGGDAWNPLQASVTNLDDITSWAVYAEGYWDITDKTTLTFGGRYTDDKVTHSWKDSTFAADGSQTAKFDQFTPRLALNYRADWGSFYASYSQGFKAGGFNSPGFSEQGMVEPEDIDAYEIGAKLTPADNIMIDLALFHYKWDNLQVAIIDTSGGGIHQQNAANAEIDGFEFGIRWAASEMVTLGLASAFLDGEFTDFTDASVFIPEHFFEPGARGLRGGQVMDLTGHRLPMTPDTSVSADMNVAFPMGDNWNGQFNIIAAYTSDYDMIVGAGGPAQLTIQDSFTVVNLSLVFESQSGIGLQLYVDNATDEEYLFESQTTTDGGYQGVMFPRVIGARARYTW